MRILNCQGSRPPFFFELQDFNLILNIFLARKVQFHIMTMSLNYPDQNQVNYFAFLRPLTNTGASFH